MAPPMFSDMNLVWSSSATLLDMIEIAIERQYSCAFDIYAYLIEVDLDAVYLFLIVFIV